VVTALDEVVLLVHGFAAKPLLLSPLQRRIQRVGYQTVRWKYFSLHGSLERHARRLRLDVDRLAEEFPHVHVVGHSMGCIVARLALSYSPAPRVGRVVLIAPPNGGVPLATTFSPLFRPFCSAVCELSHEPHSFVNRLTDPHFLEIGVIAGRFDFLVPPRRTQLTGQKDHICLPGTHNSLLLQKRAANQVISFLRTGGFETRSGGSGGALLHRSA